MNKPTAQIINRAQPVSHLDRTIPNGDPYTPLNEEEGELFEAQWCCQCANDWEFSGEDCSIPIAVYANEEPPEWMFWNGAPLCIKFKHLSA